MQDEKPPEGADEEPKGKNVALQADRAHLAQKPGGAAGISLAITMLGREKDAPANHSAS